NRFVNLSLLSEQRSLREDIEIVLLGR
ncbi:hypothetical protein CUMW_101350, partial [Citrus unshiu]